jgi:radical SAM superfamily enzyme YgiQ (UPF0313 family)
MIENITEEFLDMIRLPNSDCKALNYLIVMPPVVSVDIQYRFPTGLALVSSGLKASGRNVFTLNLTYKENRTELLRCMIEENKIDVVATGGLSGQYSLLREICDTAKETPRNPLTIVGGGIITADPEVAMNALETADYGVVGEGEIAINALAYALETDADASAVSGVIVKNGGYTPPCSEIGNLDCLPFPDYEGLEYGECLKRKHSGAYFVDEYGMSIALSRSCTHNCTFCFHSSGKRYRRRSINNVFKEIDWLKSKYDFHRMSISDELFGGDADYIEEFCDRIKPYNIQYCVQFRVDTANEHIFRLLRESGCVSAILGVEHVNDKILKSMRKHITVGQIEAAFDAAAKVGLPANGNIIFGDVEETQETVMQCLQWWKSHPNYHLNVNWLITFPGSHIYKVACNNGLISDRVKYLREGCPQINLSKMSDAEYEKMHAEVSKYIVFNELNRISYDMNSVLKKLTINHKIAVWPVRVGEILALEDIAPAFCDSENVYFVNINTKDHSLMTSVFQIGRNIHLPTIIDDKQIDLVICPRLLFLDEIRDICRNEYPSVREVVHLSEVAKFTDDR